MNLGIATAGKAIGVSIWFVVLLFGAVFAIGYLSGKQTQYN